MYGRLSSFRVYRFDTVCVCQRGLVLCACKVRNTRRLEAQLGVSVVRGAQVRRFIKVATVICLATKCSNQDGRRARNEGVGQQVGRGEYQDGPGECQERC